MNKYISALCMIGMIVPLFAVALTDDVPLNPDGDAGGYCPNLVQTLEKGSRDSATVPKGQVSELQIFLTSYYDLDENILTGGYFGNLTKKYVVKFQNEQGLPAYGIAGSLTRAKISAACQDTAGSTSGSTSTTRQVSSTISSVGTAPVTFDAVSPKPGGVYTSGSAIPVVWKSTGAPADAYVDITAIETCLQSNCRFSPVTVGPAPTSGSTYWTPPTGILGNWNVNFYLSRNESGLVTPISVPITITNTKTKTKPVVALVPLPSTGLNDGRLLRFSISADNAGTVGIAQIALALSSAVDSVRINAFTDPSFSNPYLGEGAGGLIPMTRGSTDQEGRTYYTVLPSTPIEIPAGTTYYFQLKSDAPTINSLTATLLEDVQSMQLTTCLAAMNGGSFIWSPNTHSNSNCQMSDWTNGYGVRTFPVSQTRSSASAGTLPVTITPTSGQSPLKVGLTFTLGAECNTYTVNWGNGNSESAGGSFGCGQHRSLLHTYALTTPNAATYTVKVTDTTTGQSGGGTVSVTPAPAPTFNFVNPPFTGAVGMGSSQSIRWTYGTPQNKSPNAYKVSFSYALEGSNWADGVDAGWLPLSQSQATWNVRTDIPPGTYRLKASIIEEGSTGAPLVAEVKSEPFIIATNTQTLSVISITPSSGVNGTNVVVTGTGFGSSNMINFVSGNNTYSAGYQVPSINSGTRLSFPLTLPTMPSGMYTVQVCSNLNNQCVDSSVAFTLNATASANVTISSPTPGQSTPLYGTVPIAWQSTGQPAGAVVEVLYSTCSDGSCPSMFIGQGLPTSGAINWTAQPAPGVVYITVDLRSGTGAGSYTLATKTIPVNISIIQLNASNATSNTNVAATVVAYQGLIQALQKMILLLKN